MGRCFDFANTMRSGRKLELGGSSVGAESASEAIARRQSRQGVWISDVSKATSADAQPPQECFPHTLYLFVDPPEGRARYPWIRELLHFNDKMLAVLSQVGRQIAHDGPDATQMGRSSTTYVPLA